MGEQLYATFDGEGPNVAATNATATTPDVMAASTNASAKGQGRTSAVVLDRRKRLRTSDEPGRSSVAINFGADQVLTVAARAIYVSTAGTLVLRGPDDTADQTFVLAVGWHPLMVALIRSAGSSGVVGQLVF